MHALRKMVWQCETSCYYYCAYSNNISTVPTASPSNVQLTVQSSSSILLSWKPPLPEQQNGRLVYYHVMIMETQLLHMDDGTVISSVGVDVNTTFNVTGSRTQLIEMLHPSYNYTVRMAAVTSVGIGPFSAPVTATTLEDGMFCVCCFFTMHGVIASEDVVKS